MNPAVLSLLATTQMMWGMPAGAAAPSPTAWGAWAQVSQMQASMPIPPGRTAWPWWPGGRLSAGLAETEPIQIPSSTDIPGTAERPTYYVVHVAGGAVVVHLWALDENLHLQVWPSTRGTEAVSGRAHPLDSIVLVSPDDPWVMIRVAPADPARPSRFVLRAAPAVIGEATPGATAPAQSMAPIAPWGTMMPAPGMMAPGTMPAWPAPPQAPAPQATVSPAAASPAAPPPPAVEAPAPVPAPRAEEAPPAAEPPGADAPPGVAGVVRPGAEVAGEATADVYYAVRLDENRPFAVTLEPKGGADLDLVVWASNGSRSWESSRAGAAVEEVTVDPVTDSWYIVRIAPRAAGRFVLRVRYR